RSKAYRLYISDTHTVEETIHAKFDDKEPDKASELVEGISDLQVSDDEALEPPSFSEPINFSESLKVLASTNSEIQSTEVTLDPAVDIESEEDEPSKNTFKYRSSHPEELIIGNKNSP
ncbi:putative reverse transcriptase (RNA-dependent DNA polymerase), partial [Trifolium medium]|nr:putative reverse transcriptase (RNA-dependent DNA polymerase) [Trifolium medium]